MTAVEDAPVEQSVELPPAGSLEAIMAADDTRGVDVDVPEWRMTVKVRGMTRAEAIKFSDIEDFVESNAHLIACGLVEPKVTIEQAREIVERKSQLAVARIFREVMRLSGLGGNFQVEEPGSPVPEGPAE